MPRPAVRAARQIGRTDGDRVFRAAARHSRFVRFLRMAIPAGIALVALVIVGAAFFNPFKLIAAFPIDPGKISLSGTKIVMELPRLNGFTNDARPYELTARAAAQDFTQPDFLELKDIGARVDMKDGQRLNLSAKSGLYNTKSEILKLNDHIVLTTSGGNEAYLSEATANMSTGYMVSESPVEVKFQDGLLNANRLEVMENGDLLRFGGGVEMLIKAQTPPQRAAAEGATASIEPVPIPPQRGPRQ
jgi:lipopolysaccharide export system protein LptC